MRGASQPDAGRAEARGVADLEPANAPHLKALLAPYPSEEMIAWPVGPRVGNVKNNDPSLIKPIAGAG
jgi:putative SOS response-associated peptidase YedK